MCQSLEYNHNIFTLYTLPFLILRAEDADFKSENITGFATFNRFSYKESIDDLKILTEIEEVNWLNIK